MGVSSGRTSTKERRKMTTKIDTFKLIDFCLKNSNNNGIQSTTNFWKTKELLYIITFINDICVLIYATKEKSKYKDSVLQHNKFN